jgi:hypothetical protein
LAGARAGNRFHQRFLVHDAMEKLGADDEGRRAAKPKALAWSMLLARIPPMCVWSFLNAACMAGDALVLLRKIKL